MSRHGELPVQEKMRGLHRDDIDEIDAHEYDLEQFTPNLQRALVLAAYAHQGQRRKLADIPFLAHPYETMLMVATLYGIDPYSVAEGSADEAMLMGALLHDAVEDSEGRVTLQIISEVSGEATAGIVALATRDKQKSDDEYFDRLRQSGDTMACRVVAADKAHALTCRVQEFYRLHDASEDAFSVSNKDKIVYYQGVYDALHQDLAPGDPIFDVFQELIDVYAEQVGVSVSGRRR